MLRAQHSKPGLSLSAGVPYLVFDVLLDLRPLSLEWDLLRLGLFDRRLLLDLECDRLLDRLLDRLIMNKKAGHVGK